MSNLTVTHRVQVNVKQEIQLPQQQPAPVQPAPVQAPPKAPVSQDSLQLQVKEASQPKVPTTPVGIVKKLAGGALIGGTVASVAQSVGSSIVSSGYSFQGMPPTLTGAGLGAALGLGIGLANVETSDKNVNNIKKVVSGALIGGSAAGMATAIGKTIFSDSVYKAGQGMILNVKSPSAIGIGLGIAAGLGIAILNMEE